MHLVCVSTNQQVVAVYSISSKLIEKFARKWVHKFLISHTIVTLMKVSHPKWYQNIDFSNIYHHTKLKRNQTFDVQMQTTLCLLVFFLNIITQIGLCPLNAD